MSDKVAANAEDGREEMIRVAINGAAGRMGRRLVALASAEDGMQVVAALEQAGHPDLGRDAGELAGCGHIGVTLSSEWRAAADVLIDFSTPGGTMLCLAQAVERGVAVVIGTTGLDEQQKQQITEAGKKVGVLLAPNMSVGVNLLFRLVGEVAAALGEDYDIEIGEAHHRFKKDAPSGTALRLAENICAATGREIAEDLVHGRQGLVGERRKKEIGMHAVRAGDIVGEHTVIFSTLGERLELTHRAHTRDTFARGALRAARFLAGREAGMYGMGDVLSTE